MSDHRSRQAAEDPSPVQTGDPHTTAARGQHVLILGGGDVGPYTALQLQKKLCRGEARVTLVDPRSYMTYQPFLPEAAAGSLEPRNVVVSLRREPARCRGDHRSSEPGRPSAPHGHGHPRGRRPNGAALRPGGRCAGFHRADTADPGPGRHRGRLQARGGSHRPAQPRARPPGCRGSSRRPGAPRPCADVRVRGRRLRRDRGARRAGGHDPDRGRVPRRPGRRGPVLRPRRGVTASPPGGRRGHGEVHA
jgi:hypothetical protein